MKCESKHWYVCGSDGRSVYGHVITKFSEMGRFTYQWCSAGMRERAPLSIKNYYRYIKDTTYV